MKKIILFFCFVLASNAFSQLKLDENFSYPVGDSLGAHGWTSFSGGATNRLVVTSPTLTYAGYPLSGIGEATSVTTTGQDAYTQMNSIADSNNSTAVYCAFMVNVTSAQRPGDYFLALLPSTSTTFFSGRVFVRLDSVGAGGPINFGLTKASQPDTNTVGIWTTSGYALNTTYLIVLKYKWQGAPLEDEVSLFVFSTGFPATEPVPTIGPFSFASTSSDANNIARVALRQGTANRAPNAIVDGIRVTTSWFPSVWNIKLAMQGLYDPGTGVLNKRDTVNVYLQSTSNPGVNVDSSSAVIDSVTLTGTYTFANATDGSYYLLVKYRNMPEFRNGLNTWSKSGGESLTRLNGAYDFTTSASQAFGNNMILEGSVFTIFSGDVSQEGTVDLTDLIATQNASTSFVSGYLNTDMNGDDQTTLADVLIVYNNSSNFVMQVAP